MNTEQVDVLSDDREEGEIFDDDIEFEDISDNSIIEDYFLPGKSVSSKDRLRALSLSSISDVEVRSVVGSNSKRKHHTKHRRKSKAQKRETLLKQHKAICKAFDTDESDDNEFAMLDKRTQRKLKEAICINSTDSDTHHNSLRTRLKAMINVNEESSDSAATIIYDNNDVQSSPNVLFDEEFSECLQEEEGASEVIENDLDPELQQLRIEALKTAILNKYKHKKKRKADTLQDNVLSDTSQKSDILETNKENDQVVSNRDANDHANKKLCTAQTNNNADLKEEESPSIEEDEDVLRALLLASMSRKMTENNIEIRIDDTSTIKQPVKVVQDNQHLCLLANKAKVTSEVFLDKPYTKNNMKSLNSISHLKRSLPEIDLINNKKIAPQNRNLFTLPTVKPLIINVNQDSDSDDDIFSLSSSPEKPISNELKVIEKEIESVPFEIRNSVDQFLKKERAKVESKTVATQPTKPPEKSSKIENIFTKVQTNTFKLVTTNELTNNFKKLGENNVNSRVVLKPEPNIKTTVVNKSVIKLHNNKAIDLNKGKRNVLEKSAVKLLPKNKQIEYQKLLLRLKNAEKRPIVRKLSLKSSDEKTSSTLKKVPKHATSKVDEDKNQKLEDKKKEILQLQSALNDIQVHLNGRLQIKTKYHTLSPIVKKLKECRKEKVKQEATVKKLLQDLTDARNQLTRSQGNYSSLVRDLIKNKEIIDSSIMKEDNNKKQYTSTPIKDHPIKLEKFEESCILLNASSNNTKSPAIKKDDAVKATIKSSSSPSTNSKCSILQSGVKSKTHTLKAVFINCNKVESSKVSVKAMQDYISPLGSYGRSDMKIDPLGVMCPYEVDGSCRDPECTYTHYK